MSETLAAPNVATPDAVTPVVGNTGSSSSEVEPRREWPWKKARKVAVMLSFAGKNYYGMQINKEFPTIEKELLRAIHTVGGIPKEWHDDMKQAFFQRASRTDKGVSAAKMIVSLKMLFDEKSVTQINAHLPSDIRVQSIRRVTKNFDAKNSCDARTYLYMLPTFVFCPIEEVCNENFRIDEKLRTKVNDVLSKFVGSHFFHNYTSGKLPLEPSSRRLIYSFTMGSAFESEGLEFALVTVKGQSFMLHQIRKMIGLAISVVRGNVDDSVIDVTWKDKRIDIPRAPGLGLMLEEVHFDRYNRRFGSDGIHEPLLWEREEESVERFKTDVIFADMAATEKKEKGMLTWLDTLLLHSFEPRHFESLANPVSIICEAKRLVDDETKRKAEVEESRTSVDESVSMEEASSPNKTSSQT